MKFICLFVCILWTPSFSQNIRISVQNTAQEPIRNARITIFNADTTLFYELRSDSISVAVLNNRPQVSLSIGVSAPGYLFSQSSVDSQQDTLSIILESGDPIGKWEVLRSADEKLGGTNSAVLLPDGRIFYCHDTQDPILFDPVTNTVQRAKKSPKIQGCAATCLLQDGMVIFVGGADREVYGPGTKQVKVYDPLKDEWQFLPEILDYRWYPTMVQLPGGELLAIGGGGLNNPKRVNTCEILNPESRLWTPTDTVAIGNEVSPVVLLNTGEVLITHRPPQLFNPLIQKWRLATPFVQSPRTPDGDHADHELTMLPDGRVVAIGYMQKYRPSIAGHNVEIYDPINNRWSLGADLPPVRSRCKSVLLPTKRILVAGGFKETANDTSYVNQYGYMRRADLYDPYANSWSSAGQMNIAREYHATPVLIPDGRVVIAAGEGQPGNEPPDTSVIEAYYPSYFYKGIRPKISTALPSAIIRGQSISFEVLYTAKLTSVVLMGTSAVTHFMNSGNVRCLELPFQQTGSSVTVSLPADSNALPLGYYMLIPLVDDIPGVGKIVKIEANQNQSAPFNFSDQKGCYIANITPQPCTDALRIRIISDRRCKPTVKILDLTGKMYSSRLSEIEEGVNEVVINTRELNSGVYSVVLKVGDGIHLVEKFIKL